MTAHRPRTIRLLEIASVACFAAAVAALALRLWAVTWDTPQLSTLCAAVFFGYVAADVASGVAHWFCDTFFEEDTPVIGRALIQPFREHHTDPLAITRHGFFEVNGNTCLALLPVVLAVLLAGDPAPGDAAPSLFVQCFLLVFAVATFGTNQFHKWAHQERPAPAVRWMQSLGLIVSPDHHDRHHREPYRQAFCITAGWCDSVLDGIGIFERIERAVRRNPMDRVKRVDGRH